MPTAYYLYTDHPLISESPVDTTVTVGEPAALKCRVNSGRSTIRWKKDGRNINVGELKFCILSQQVAAIVSQTRIFAKLSKARPDC